MKKQAYRNIFFVLAFCLFNIGGIGQTVKIQGGTSISKLDLQYYGLNVNPVYEDYLIGYSVFIGVDYLDRPYFNFTGNLGMIRRGGKGEIELTNINGDSLGTKSSTPTLDYISINTTFELKRKFWNKVTPFVSIGPRVDYLVGYTDLFDDLEDIDELEKVAYGLILGGGIKYNPSKFQIGLRADYYMDFTKVGEWSFDNGIGGEVNSSTITIQLLLGYSLN